MYKKNSTNRINQILCSRLLLKLQTVENKCDRITIEISEVKQLITSFPPDVGSLIDSIERSAKDMHDQSIRHREYVEQCINSEPTMYLVRKLYGDGLQ